ncbi:Holliday junction resolvase RuvX [Chlorogloeopsis sp. ULAP01]|uniref:Holliday junction resolvase RuvX n=1 Tax=Chlorogloeopsis sp. ULAP01 TaxID=3056483 RepID=UPI0025AA5063|nr:Holliday junction resolvase RuvX [Chlorogloeopsis sp. ULAP01]MDM9382977.1 Holliday junction resolvase RuvX [Chlorogloeopsis sp. ULAP01]
MHKNRSSDLVVENGHTKCGKGGCGEIFSSDVSLDSIKKTKAFISALGLDVGRKRIGVAGCDRTGLIATGITTIERTSFERDVEQIRQLVVEREVQVLVVGLPYSMDGSLGFQARQVQKFAKQLSKVIKLPLEYVDERLTSFQAEQLLIAENRSPSRHKALIDRKAAALILQQWLDARRTNLKFTEVSAE